MSKNTLEYLFIQIQVEKPEKVETFSVKMNETGQFCQLEIYRFPLKYFDLSGNTYSREPVSHREIISYYQPDSGLFWSDFHSDVNNSWKKQVKDSFFSSDGKIFPYLSDHQIVFFSIPIGDHLLIRESQMRYQSIFEAYKRVILVIEDNKKELMEGNFYKWYSCLPLASYYIDHHFFYLRTFDPFESLDYARTTTTKIINITRQQDCWKIELEGNHGRQAQLILRSQLENQEEPILLRDYCKNNHYEVLEVWVDGVKKEIPHSSDKQ